MDTFQEQIRTIQSPTPIVGFDELRVPIHLHIIRDILSGESTSVALNNIYTFSTCEDIARALWLQMGQDPAYHPNYVFFGIPNTPSESPTSELKYSSLTINWLQAISEEEREYLDKLRDEFNMSKQHANSILNETLENLSLNSIK